MSISCNKPLLKTKSLWCKVKKHSEVAIKITTSLPSLYNQKLTSMLLVKKSPITNLTSFSSIQTASTLTPTKSTIHLKQLYNFPVDNKDRSYHQHIDFTGSILQEVKLL